jgi:hypothetical protein
VIPPTHSYEQLTSYEARDKHRSLVVFSSVFWAFGAVEVPGPNGMDQDSSSDKATEIFPTVPSVSHAACLVELPTEHQPWFLLPARALRAYLSFAGTTPCGPSFNTALIWRLFRGLIIFLSRTHARRVAAG